VDDESRKSGEQEKENLKRRVWDEVDGVKQEAGSRDRVNEGE